MEDQSQITFFVGTYTDTIHKLSYNISTKQCNVVEEIKGLKNPSFVKFIKEDNILITVSETQDKPLVVLIDLEKSSSNYGKVIQELPTYGADPCFVGYSKKNNLVFVANYTGSTLATYQYREKKLTHIETLKYESESTEEKGEKQNQIVSHPHSVVMDSSEQYAFLQDLGCDLIRIYELNSQAKPMQLKKTVKLPQGCGPRHMYHQNEKFYLNGELNNIVYVFDFDRKEIDLKQVQSYTLIKEGTKDIPASYSAEIKVDEDGKIYNSCRGVDRLFIIPQNGQEVNLPSNDDGQKQLYNQPSISTQGKWPRHFNLNNQVIICAHQHSNNIVFFDKKTLTQCNEISIEKPVYIELI